MKTLEDFKETIAQELGYISWRGIDWYTEDMYRKSKSPNYFEEKCLNDAISRFAAHVWEEACRKQKFNCAMAAKKYQNSLTKEDATKQTVCILNCENAPYPNK